MMSSSYVHSFLYATLMDSPIVSIHIIFNGQLHSQCICCTQNALARASCTDQVSWYRGRYCEAVTAISEHFVRGNVVTIFRSHFGLAWVKRAHVYLSGFVVVIIDKSDGWWFKLNGQAATRRDSLITKCFVILPYLLWLYQKDGRHICTSVTERHVYFVIETTLFTLIRLKWSVETAYASSALFVYMCIWLIHSG